MLLELLPDALRRRFPSVSAFADGASGVIAASGALGGGDGADGPPHIAVSSC
mgnify:FL=1